MSHHQLYSSYFDSHAIRSLFYLYSPVGFTEKAAIENKALTIKSNSSQHTPHLTQIINEVFSAKLADNK